ncbi:hypothetical protein [Streptomyces sp. NPDC048272]|uniref:hypothetical protein n=1 Tax=Streptomyces sp. NPDC048272 TaxID=3154616 RepID=UPI0034252969
MSNPMTMIFHGGPLDGRAIDMTPPMPRVVHVDVQVGVPMEYTYERYTPDQPDQYTHFRMTGWQPASAAPACEGTEEAAGDREDTVSHLYKIFYGDLGMCGCGNPDEAYKLIRDLLALTPLYEGSRWQRAEELTGRGATNHIILSSLERAGLMEHGSSLNGAWLTDKGEWCLAAMRDVEFSELDGAGYPHDLEECTDNCWTVTLPSL